jgi:hypothetical protein
METSERFWEAMSGLEAPLYNLADLLDELHGVSAGSLREYAARIGGAVDSYVAASDAVGGQIVLALREPSAQGAPDGDAVARLAASIGMDLRFAEELVALSRVEPEDDLAEDQEFVVDFAAATQDVLGANVREEVELIKYFIANGEEYESSADARTPAPPLPEDPYPSIQGGSEAPSSEVVLANIGKIVSGGGGTLAETISQAAAGPFLAAVGVSGSLNTLLGPLLGKAVNKVLTGTESKWWRKISRGFFRLVNLVIKKIRAAMGLEALRPYFDSLRDLIDRLTGKVGGGLLGLVIDRPELERACDQMLSGKDSDVILGAGTACQKVADAHEKRLGYVGYGNFILGGAAGAAGILKLAGSDVLIAVAAVALIIYTVWLVHDHLDSSKLQFLPNHVPGIRTEVQKATA